MCNWHGLWRPILDRNKFQEALATSCNVANGQKQLYLEFNKQDTWGKLHACILTHGNLNSFEKCL